MTVSILYGQPGTGKTTAATQKAIDYASAGRKVYANYPIDFAPITKRKSSKLSNASCWVIPDRPTRADLDALEGGMESEDTCALLIIDESGLWLNTRSWSSDKSRMDVIDWLTQSRKRGFDVLLIAQHPNMLDKQVRDGCIELFGRCRNMSKVKVFGLFRLPRFHICRFQFDMNPTSPVLERFVYRGGSAHKTYDTRKAFGDLVVLDESKIKDFHSLDFLKNDLIPWDNKFSKFDGMKYMPVKFSELNGHYSVLPATLTRWRYTVSIFDRIKAFFHPLNDIEHYRIKPVHVVPKHPLIARIMKLPEERRMEFFNRFSSTGAI